MNIITPTTYPLAVWSMTLAFIFDGFLRQVLEDAFGVFVPHTEAENAFAHDAGTPPFLGVAEDGHVVGKKVGR